MQRILFAVVLLLLGSFAIIASAQDHIPLPPPENHEMGHDGMWVSGITAVDLSGPDPSSYSALPAESTTFQPMSALDALLAPSGSDSCTAAADIVLTYDGEQASEYGNSTIVSQFTQDSTDPFLACMAGNPPDQRGFRSAWYRISPPVDGTLIVRSVVNSDYRLNYDTTIAIFRDDSAIANTCSTLTQIACNDDAYGLLSEDSIQVEFGETYYIEVVDRSQTSSGPITLNLEVTIIPDANWDSRPNSMPEALSRHSVVISDTMAFVLAGQTILGDSPQRSDRVYRYDTETAEWTAMSTMPAGLSAGGAGYSNTDAVLMQGEIHFASGFVGDANTYDGTHWIFNPDDNTWRTGPALPWGSSSAGAPVGFSQLVPYQAGFQSGFYVVGGTTTKFFPGDFSNATDINPTPLFARYLDTGISQSWQLLPDMSRIRYGHTAALVGDDVCVVGGLTVSGANALAVVTDGECYRPTSGTWISNVGDLNTPRYNADSAVGPDGRWYVYGGTDAAGNFVPTVEVHDFSSGQWDLAAPNFYINDPALSWVRGDFVDNRLWLFGGEQINPGFAPIPVGEIQSKIFPDATFVPGTETFYLPLLMDNAIGDTPNSAFRLTLGVEQSYQFSNDTDVYDLFQFSLSQTEDVTVLLNNIPSLSNYDLLLYNENKELLALTQQLGPVDETITRTLPAGNYIVVVVRDSPPPNFPPEGGHYRIRVSVD